MGMCSWAGIGAPGVTGRVIFDSKSLWGHWQLNETSAELENVTRQLQNANYTIQQHEQAIAELETQLSDARATVRYSLLALAEMESLGVEVEVSRLV